MKIKFLGTGSVIGVPSWRCECSTCLSTDNRDKRLRPSLLVEINDKNVIIDFGEDFRTQLLSNNIKHVDYAFLTHHHQDHADGSEMFVKAGKCVLSAPKKVFKKFVSKKLSKAWITSRNKDLILRPFVHETIDEFEVDSVKLEHNKDYGAKPPSYGYVFRSKDYSFAYLTDYNKILEPNKLYDLDLIISDGGNAKNQGRGHLDINEAVDVFKKFKPKRMLVTHINHTLKHAETCAYLEQFGNISLAYDGMEIEI
jgi:phosphoribosyl 1,2-cyclic phosphate phosphodiesterase